MKRVKFPIGVPETAKLLKLSERTIRKHCKLLGVQKLGNKSFSQYLLTENDLKKLKKADIKRRCVG